MPRYIDADALKHELCIRQHMLNADSLWKTLEIMDAQPTADVVEVVRCKDCAFCEDPHYRGNAKVNDHIKFCCQGMEPFLVHDDYFCASGMRREEINE